MLLNKNLAKIDVYNVMHTSMYAYNIQLFYWDDHSFVACLQTTATITTQHQSMDPILAPRNSAPLCWLISPKFGHLYQFEEKHVFVKSNMEAIHGY